MSDAETVVNTFSDPETMSDSETSTDGTMGDDERPSGRKRAPHSSSLPSSKPKTGNISDKSRDNTPGVDAAIRMSAIENAVFKRCMVSLKKGFSYLNDDLEMQIIEAETRVTTLEIAEDNPQREVKELRDEVKELRDQISRKGRTDAAEGIEQIEEGAPKLKRRRVEIQEHGNSICIVLG